jgi:hypothetical protein
MHYITLHYITLHYITYSTQQGVGIPLGANERLIGGGTLEENIYFYTRRKHFLLEENICCMSLSMCYSNTQQQQHNSYIKQQRQHQPTQHPQLANPLVLCTCTSSDASALYTGVCE